mgnify:CR=1 FL=1
MKMNAFTSRDEVLGDDEVQEVDEHVHEREDGTFR